MQPKSIVIFGPAESGKSTLSGYLVWKGDKNFDLEKYDKKMRQKLGSSYSPDLKFAYIVDERRDEIIRMGSKRSGSTKEMHVKETRINDDKNKLYILDTPGTEHKGRDNIKGISFADIGIFVIDQKALAKLQPNLLSKKNFELLRDILTPLSIWLRFKDNSKLIIAISKMDEFEFSQENYDKAVNLIKKFTGKQLLNSLPISINVNENLGHNIINKSEKLEWYVGDTLLDMINNLNSIIPESTDEEKPLFMKLYKEDKLKQVCKEDSLKVEINRLWRGKIFQGCIQESSEIIVAPVLHKNKLIDIPVKIKGIYNVNCTQVENSITGDIVYIDIAQKRHLRLIESTCVFGINQPFIEGNVLQFEIDDTKIERLSYSEKQKLHNLSIRGELTVTWFGTPLHCKIIDKKFTEGRLLLTIFPMHRLLNVSLPICSNGKFLYKKFLLELDNNTFIVFTLNRLTNSESVTFTLRINNENIIPRVKSFFNEFKFEDKGTELKFHSNNLAKIVKNMDNMSNVFESKDYQIFTELDVK